MSNIWDASVVLLANLFITSKENFGEKKINELRIHLKNQQNMSEGNNKRAEFNGLRNKHTIKKINPKLTLRIDQYD